MSDSTRMEHSLDPVLLSGYYDEALDDDERREVEDHLARCPACRERLAGYATLGGAIRAGTMPPAPSTLDEKVERLLRRYSSSRVADRPRPSRPPRRRPDRSWPIWSAVAAVVVLGLLAGAFLFGLPFGGGGIAPTVAAAYPCDNPTECAIAVRFNGPVDHAAVERSFRIDPPVPVTFTWQDNETLFIKPKQPLQSAVSYTVSIQLGTGATGPAIPVVAKPTPVALHFVAGAAGSPVAMANTGRSASASKATTVSTARLPSGPPGASSGSPTPGTTPTEASGTPTTAVAVPAAATGTCSIQPVRGFGTLYRDQPKVAARLGCAHAPEAGLSLVVEPFQHGQMLWLGDRRQIVALLDTGHWSSYPDTYTGAETVTPGPGEPVHGFGKVWRETPTLHDAIGAATAPEKSSDGAIEDFDHGTLVWTADRIIYTLYSDGTWEKYPDTFVDLTPTGSAVVTGSPAAVTSETATAMTATPAPSTSPAASPTPAGSPTPSPVASGSPSPAPTSSPSASTGGASCSIRPVRGFGLVYSEHPDVAVKLGCASATEIGAAATRETFEHGVMIRRDDVRQIFVMRTDGKWAVYPDTYQAGEALPDPGAAPSGKVAPVRGLAKVWLGQTGLRQALGWATAPEGAVSGAYEDFAAGQMVWTSDKTIYVLYSDGTWSSFPDTFVDPTATPGP